jgi:hypothetical protein
VLTLGVAVRGQDALQAYNAVLHALLRLKRAEVGLRDVWLALHRTGTQRGGQRRLRPVSALPSEQLSKLPDGVCTGGATPLIAHRLQQLRMFRAASADWVASHQSQVMGLLTGTCWTELVAGLQVPASPCLLSCGV